MFKVFSLFFFIFLMISTAYAKERGLNADCDAFHWCDPGLDCYDYRCQPYVAGKTDNMVPWTPEGLKCDFFHWCPTSYKCVKHRCAIAKKVKNLKQSQTQKPTTSY